MLLAILRCSLIFALLTVAAWQGKPAPMVELSTFDDAPADELTVVHKTPDAAHAEGVLLACTTPRHDGARRAIAAPFAPVRRPACARRTFSRRHHLVRRRTPRLRDDNADH